MKRKIVWLLVSSLMVAALLLASCGPAEVEEEEKVTPPPEEEVAPPEEEEVAPPAGREMEKFRMERIDGTVVEKMVEKPQYGGKITTMRTTPLGEPWDPVHAHGYVHIQEVLLALKRGDFYRGPFGTGETTYRYQAIAEHDFCTKGLASHWEITGPKEITYHLNKGVRWHDKAPMNGREVVAADVVWGYQRLMDTADSGLPVMLAAPIRMEAPDKYTFVWELKLADFRTAFTIDDWYRISPREVVEQYGDMNDWKTVVGNGPWMLTDYVSGVSFTYEKNPNYWETDYAGRPIPYIDRFDVLIITDLSTAYAAMRTGKIDMIHAVPWRDAEEILSSNPEIETTGSYPWNNVKVQFNVQTEPFSDLRVRRALAMAINHMEIRDDKEEGNSLIMPSGMLTPDSKWFMNLEDYPESVQEIYGYNPEGAKQLLAEAGYPDGFKMELEIYADPTLEDPAQMLEAYWTDIGIDIEIKTLDLGVYLSRLYGIQMPAFLITGALQGPRRESWRWTPYGAWNFSDLSFDQDTVLRDLYDEATAEKDKEGWGEEWQKVVKHLAEQVYEHQIPGPNVHTLWQPWIRNYSGELTLSSTQFYGYMSYIWVDRDLKEEMTGTR